MREQGSYSQLHQQRGCALSHVASLHALCIFKRGQCNRMSCQDSTLMTCTEKCAVPLSMPACDEPLLCAGKSG